MSEDQLDDDLSDVCFAEFLALTHKLTGITIASTRKTMLVSRLRKRLRATGSRDFESYLELIRKDPKEAEQFVNQVTTNETYFYRTPRVWEYLSEVFLPQWMETSGRKKLSAWSAAASTGAEAYTMGIVFEEFKKSNPSFDYGILGTDIDSGVIQTANEGRYVDRPVQRFRSVRPELFENHMQGNDSDGYSVSPSIRSRISFRTHNLFNKPPSGATFDVVFLRNVLIYFTNNDQKKVLHNIRKASHTDSILFIGESEALNRLNVGYESCAPFTYRPCASVQKVCA